MFRRKQSGAAQRLFRDDESGQVTFFVAIFALTLVMASLLPIPVGQAITARIQAQNAADAAALTAETWTARGDNLMQGLNGIMWDADYAFINAILLATSITQAEWASDCAKAVESWGLNIEADYQCGTGLAGGASPKWRNRKKIIKNIVKTEKATAKAVGAFQKAVKTGVPYLSYMEANQMAKKCGAGVFNPVNIAQPLLARVPVLQSLGRIIRNTEDLLPNGIQPYCWTVSPNFVPPSNHQFCKKTHSSSSWKSPLHTESYNPFLSCYFPPLFLTNISWNNDWYKSTNRIKNTHATKTVTYATTIDQQNSFALNKLFLSQADRDHGQTQSVGAVSAFGSATYSGSPLTESGWVNGAGYIAYLFGAFQYRPIPVVHSRSGFWSSDHYGGDCDTAVVPVQIMSRPGKNFAIYH